MNVEELEFQISQYVDGTLSPPQRKVVDALLQTDSAARTIIADYQRINVALAAHAWTPHLQWDQVAQHISNAVDLTAAPPVVGRIGLSQQKRRIAAAILITATAGFFAHRSMHMHPARESREIVGSSVVIGPGAEVAQGDSLEDISVGPSPALTMHDPDWRYGEGVVGRGSSNVVLLDALPTRIDKKSHAH